MAALSCRGVAAYSFGLACVRVGEALLGPQEENRWNKESQRGNKKEETGALVHVRLHYQVIAVDGTHL